MSQLSEEEVVERNRQRKTRDQRRPRDKSLSRKKQDPAVNSVRGSAAEATVLGAA